MPHPSPPGIHQVRGRRRLQHIHAPGIRCCCHAARLRPLLPPLRVHHGQQLTQSTLHHLRLLGGIWSVAAPASAASWTPYGHYVMDLGGIWSVAAPASAASWTPYGHYVMDLLGGIWSVAAPASAASWTPTLWTLCNGPPWWDLEGSSTSISSQLDTRPMDTM